MVCCVSAGSKSRGWAVVWSSVWYESTLCAVFLRQLEALGKHAGRHHPLVPQWGLVRLKSH